MASFTSFLTTKKVPSFKKFRTLLRGPFTALRLLTIALLLAICAIVFTILIILNNRTLVTVPARGGNLTEGVIGAPHFINPLLATTPTDRRLVSLVYSTLKQEMQNYTVSPDGKTYTISLLPNLRFDDKKALTSEDVAFTVEKMQNNTISDESDYWQNISIDTPDTTTVVFTLSNADTSFLDHLTFAILPKHIWQNVSDQAFSTAAQNLHPVGEGPFKVSSITYQNNIPTTVRLTRNPYYGNNTTLLKTLTINAFANQKDLIAALNNKTVDFSYSVDPVILKNSPVTNNLTTTPVSNGKSVTIYHSGTDLALSNGTNVMILNQIIDKDAIVAIVRNSYGTPAGVSGNPTQKNTTHLSLPGFSLAVENSPDLLHAAQTIAQQLAPYGVTVVVKAFDPGTFQNNITTGTFTVFLARSGDVNIPQQYSPVLPLYTETVPYIFNTRTHTIPPDTVSPTTEYSDVQHWYTNTNKLWKWLRNVMERKK